MKRFLQGLMLAAAFAGGAAQAVPMLYSTTLSGAAENPPNASPGSGSALLTYDALAHTLRVQADFMDLLGNVTAAHIHCCTAAPGNVGVAVMPPSLTGFPLGVTSGTYDQTFDLTDLGSYSASFVTNFGGGTEAGAEAALVAGLDAGQAYFNIHTSVFGGGEIRGFLAPQATVPEPQTLALVGGGLLLIGLMASRRPLASRSKAG